MFGVLRAAIAIKTALGGVAARDRFYCTLHCAHATGIRLVLLCTRVSLFAALAGCLTDWPRRWERNMYNNNKKTGRRRRRGGKKKLTTNRLFHTRENIRTRRMHISSKRQNRIRSAVVCLRRIGARLCVLCVLHMCANTAQFTVVCV